MPLEHRLILRNDLLNLDQGYLSAVVDHNWIYVVYHAQGADDLHSFDRFSL